MKAVTTYEKDAERLTKRLRPITDKQLAEAKLSAGAIYIGRQESWCSGCNHVFKTELWKKDVEVVKCPCCGKTRAAHKSASRCVENSKYYFTITTTCGGYQVIRNFFCEKNARREFSQMFFGEELAHQDPHIGFFCKEVSQLWLTPNCQHVAVIGRSAHGAMFYNDIWNFDSPMTVKRNQHDRYFYTGYNASGPNFLPEMRRNGLRRCDDNVCTYTLIRKVMTDPFAESLLKHRQHALLRAYINNDYHCGRFSEDLIASIRIAMRHKYTVKDAKMYLDYLRDCQRLHYDMRNPFYICPKNLHKAHAQTTARLQIIEERQRREADMRQLAADQKAVKRYEVRMQFFAGIVLKDGNLTVSAIPTVEAVREEGLAMHHCVFANQYYKNDAALLMTARMNGKRVETVEFNLRTGIVEQSRGLQNSLTPQHKRICALVRANSDILLKAGRDSLAAVKNMPKPQYRLNAV